MFPKLLGGIAPLELQKNIFAPLGEILFFYSRRLKLCLAKAFKSATVAKLAVPFSVSISVSLSFSLNCFVNALIFRIWKKKI